MTGKNIIYEIIKKTKRMNIYIFTRDLRIHDNKLFNASMNKKTLPIFIFNPKQLDSSYASKKSITFMVESLIDLDKDLRKHSSGLSCYIGDPINILTKLCKENNVEGIYIMADYSPFASERYEKISELARSNNISIFSDDTQILDSMCFSNYKKYTYYYNDKKHLANASNLKITNYPIRNLLKRKGKSIDHFKYLISDKGIIDGGRTAGLKLLRTMNKFKSYGKTRNICSIPTTLLSAYMKYGVVSVSEVLLAVKKGDAKNLTRQILWRDFYYSLAFNNPSIFEGHEMINKINWRDMGKKSVKKDFKAWKDGKTGFLLCDAGMRELKTTGFMHNRVRMLVVYVLSKLLLINWRYGEKHFAQNLTDYDWVINSMNWQNVLGGWYFAMPYFRVMNPMMQLKKHDPDCEYVKKWLPEIRDIPNKCLLKWDTEYQNYNVLPPIADYKKAKRRFLKEIK